MLYTELCPFVVEMGKRNGYEFPNPVREKGNRTHDTAQLRGEY